MTRFHRGFSRSDLASAIVCAGLLITFACVATAQDEDAKDSKPAMHALAMKDATQLRNIHQGFLVFAREFDDVFPRPGIIDRLPVNGREEPGRGEEDITQNTTANLHSACIMQNYYTPDLAISPVERNPKVRGHVDADYNYERYNVVQDVYWDPAFKADLTAESNVSYANLVLFGERKNSEWRATMNAKFAVLGNRGPKDGQPNPDSFTCGPHGNWAGNVAFNDNHVEFLNTTQPEQLTFKAADGQEKSDNLFAIDDGMGGKDMILSFTSKITKDGAELQWD